MAECSICLDPLFQHEPPIASSSSSQPPLLVQRKVVSLPCGHVFHDHCIQAWFDEKGRPSNWKCICNCTQKPTKATKITLFFAGNAWAEAERELNSTPSAAIKGKARALEGKVSELSVDSSGKEMQRVLGLGGVIALIQEMKRLKEDEWVELKEDEQLKSSLVSLTSSLDALLPKLHYSYRNTSLVQTISELEATISAHQTDLDSLAKQHDLEIQELKKQALFKLNTEEERSKQQRKRDRTRLKEEQDSWKTEKRGFEQLVARMSLEKKELASRVQGLEESAADREGSLSSQRAQINKLTAKLVAQKEFVKKLETENLTLVSERETKQRKRARTEDVDEEGNFLSDDEEVVDVGDDILEVGDESWRSEKEPIRSSTISYGSVLSSKNKILQTSNVNRSTVAFDPSSISNNPNKRKEPSSSFSSGPRTKIPPPTKTSFQTISSAASLFSGSSGGTFAIGRKSSRR